MELPKQRQYLFSGKPRIAFILLGFLLPINSNAQNNQKTISIIKQMEYDWHHAYVSHDSSKLKVILADNFINLGRTGGRATKSQTLENFRKDSSIYEYCEPFDFEFRVFPKTVIVLCRTKEKGIDNGKLFSNVYFSYDIFIKQQKRWECVQAGVNLVSNK